MNLRGRVPPLVVVGVCLVWITVAIGMQHPPILRCWERWLATIDQALQSDGPWVVVEPRPLTKFAFGPGGEGVAYCAPVSPEGASGLWVVPASSGVASEKRLRLLETTTPRLLLWAAPEGMQLGRAVQWAPDGTRVAVRVLSDESSDLALIDYVTGSTTWLTAGEHVVSLAWHPSSDALGYVTDDGSARTVWFRSLCSAEPLELGEDGFALGWSTDGSMLTWISGTSETGWTQIAWDGSAASSQSQRESPARIDSAIRFPRWPVGCSPVRSDHRREAPPHLPRSQRVRRASAVLQQNSPTP